MPSSTLGEMTANHSQDNTPNDEPATGWTRETDGTITYVFDGREVEYEEYLDLLRNDRTSGISPKDLDIMISETPEPGDLG
jgi:hypothetical protein